MVKGIGFEKLNSIQDALGKLLKSLKSLDVEHVDIFNSVGRVLAEDVFAPIDVPPFDRATMDGYACRAEDTFGASIMSPILLRCVGSVKIGEVPKISIKSGEVVKIPTGGMIPNGANSVINLEYTKDLGETIEIYKSVTPYKNISKRGEDVRRGEVVIRRGEILQPQDAGILSSLGIAKVKVYKKPKVAVISTGNELVQVGERLTNGKIYSSNNPMICNALRELNFEPINLGIARDNENEITRKLENSLNYDAAIFTGGTSVGEKDLVPLVVERYGKILFHGVAMRPGQPTAAAIVDNKPIFMLPGSPAAALLSFYIFVVPSLYRLMNIKIILRKWSKVEGELMDRIPSEIGIQSNVRVYWEKGKIYPIRISGSGILTSFVKANALLEVPENKEGYEKGEIVEVMLIRDITEVCE